MTEDARMAVTPNDSLGAGQRDAMEFTLRLGHALSQAGYPADSLYVMLQAVSARLGLPQVESYSTATGLNLAFGPLRQHGLLFANLISPDRDLLRILGRGALDAGMRVRSLYSTTRPRT